MRFALCFLRLLFFSALVAGAAPADAQLNSQEQQIASLLSSASGQGRDVVEVNAILSRVARARAMDLAKRDYFDHVNPDGKGANTLVREAGYPLPSNYDQAKSGNNIESIAAGYATPQSAWSNWMTSPSHQTHLLAQNAFFAEQTSIGVGYYYDPNSTYKYYWCVLTAPPTGPTLAVNSPLLNAAIDDDAVTISGTTGGTPAAARLTYRLENAAGTSDFRALAGTKTWSGSVSGLAPGANLVRVRSLDSAGGTLKEVTRSFRRVVLKPLTVSVEGAGSVSAGFAGTSNREVGAPYTVTARPAAGWLFERWSGSVNSTSANLNFTMEDGFSLVANFRENPFVERKGSYNGLITSSLMTHATSGFLKLTTAISGAFSGTLTLGGKAYHLSGKFDLFGNAVVTIKRGKTLVPLAVNLHLDLEGGTDRITGAVTDGTFTSSLTGDQANVAETPHFAEGRYTLALPANVQNSGATYPQGDGFAFIKVSAAGIARVTGTLADGRVFSKTASISKDGALPVYSSLLAGTGSLLGTLQFQNGSSNIAGTLVWTKPERPGDRYYPDPFVMQIAAVGSRYEAPIAGTPVLDVADDDANATLWLSDGNLSPAVPQPATLLSTNRVTISDPLLPKLTLAITAATGRFTGSFTHPLTKAVSRIRGAIVSGRNAGFGFFLGQDESGSASFVPAGQ